MNKGTCSRTDRAVSCCALAEGLAVACVLLLRTQGCELALQKSLVCMCFVLFYLDLPLHHRVGVPLSSTSWIHLDEDEFSKSLTCPYASTVIRWDSLNINFWSVKFPCLFIL